MKRLKWNRKLSILVLIMFITVTFASFNTNLFIDGNAYLRVDRDIRITNIHLLETEYNGYENTGSEYTNRTISTDISLPLQASSVTYEVTISNVSDKRYKIADIIEDSYDNPDVKYEILDASIGNIVEPHTEKTFRVRFTNRVTIVEEEDVYRTFTYNFIYTGDEQTFVVPFTGEYTLEVWGAQGGNTGEARGGFGGYSTGKINLTKGQTLYVNVGGAGASSTTRPAKLKGGYNGGGTGYQNSHYTETFGSGGGATHIATTSGELYKLNYFRDNIIIVAGGGGGAGGNEAGTRVENGGSGGGKVGNKGASTNSDNRCSGGSQTDGGAAGHEGLAGSFGKGASYNNTTSLGVNSRKGGGGGGGYYGGGSNGWTSSGSCGGSGYIGNTNLTDKAMYCFNCTEASDEDIKSINVEEHYETPTSQCAKEGNGFAKITITSKVVDGSEFDYSFMNAEQTFVAPYSGSYKLETWGAQGGSYNTTYAGGYGGYSVGSIDLNKNDQLYINVGGAGGFYPSDQVVYDGGYNGGGSCRASVNVDVNVGCGGGATHIATASGLLSTLENNKDSVLIVSGGGGGAIYYYNSSTARYTCPGGSGGGYIGNSANLNVIASAYTLTGAATGGTQSSGGIGMQSTFNGTTDDKTEDGSFGKGGGYIGVVRETGGGGGWYGGASGSRSSAAGGSGYIGNTNLTDKKMYCFNCETSNAVSTRTQTTSTHSLVPKKNIAKEGNGYSKITLLKRTVNQTKLTLDFTFEEYVNGNEYLFGYTGSEQVFNVPKTGIYKLEVWGAQGKTNDYCSSNNCIGGYGGYSVGNVKLYKGTTLYLTVGEYGRNKKQAFGGGGYADLGGGGASHIAYKSGTLASLENSLDDILIVAGGGGGNDTSNSINPSGGGFRGTNGFYSSEVLGGWQEQHSTTNDYSGLFGQGGTAAYVDRETYLDYGGAGGGGFYGGDGSPGGSGSGGGGSGYIANPSLSDKSMYCYNCTESDADSTKTISTENHSVDPISNYAKEENGYAKITCIEETTDYIFDYTGDVQEFVAPYNGIYKVELWGAQGGDNTSSKIGGKGGYTSGNVSLSKGTKLYVYVGEHKTIRNNPSFNGALNSTNDGASAGGATDVRLVSSENWYDFDSLKTRIMVAGGGGATSDSASYPGGDAGGLVGYRTIGSSGQCSYPGTQISPGTENCWGNYQPGNFSNGSFGLGSRYGASGGSGWFGGAGGYNKFGGGSGGSSFISGHPGCVSITENSTEDNISFVNDSNEIACNDENSVSYNSVGYNMNSACNKHYSGKVFTDTVMIDGQGYAWDENGKGNSVVGMPSPDGRTTMVGNVGNGYARITLLERTDDYNITYDLDGGTLSNPKNTYYEFEEDFSLGTPTKDGHIFLGWIGGKNAYPSPSFEHTLYSYSIPSGLIGNNQTKIEYDKENVYITAVQTHDSWQGAISEIFTLRPRTSYILSVLVDGDGSAPRVGIYDYGTNDYVINRYITNERGQLDIPFTTDNTGKVRILFGMGPSNENTVLNFKNIYIEEGTELSTYEAVNDTPDKNLIIPARSTGNRYYKAVWSSNTLCKKATYLHRNECRNNAGENKMCTAAGYELGELITYGSIPTGSSLDAGFAYDCDVNGDGKYDSVNERFYYLVDLQENTDYAVLIYSSTVVGGVRNTNQNTNVFYDSANKNFYGPRTAYLELPDETQWSNVLLYNRFRQITNELGETTNNTNTLPVFEYTNKTSRLPTYQEINTLLGGSTKVTKQYEFTMEDTSFDTRSVFTKNWGIWLETPYSGTNAGVWKIDSHSRQVGKYDATNEHFLVKPVIEVQKTKIQ